MNIDFDVKSATEGCINWIKDYALASNMKKAITGISGGKDSYVAAALCCKALGNENVIGVLMPNDHQSDFEDAVFVCHSLEIESILVNIGEAYTSLLNEINEGEIKVSKEAKVNIAPRLRMTTLYTLGQTLHARVCGTGNLSEITVGYCTKYGDTACDFNPLASFTTFEVQAIGDYLGLSDKIVHKTPSDGLSGMSDEEKLGISYKDIHNYIRGGEVDESVAAKIKEKQAISAHKFNPVPVYTWNK